ncbi:MAG: NAD-dependent epimerase/dehydratase family protein [Woeseiaceae bacterium]|nr:NAD-dependent epimerase/dehydratase family protein [Woeseiaceae bacterium]
MRRRDFLSGAIGASLTLNAAAAPLMQEAPATPSKLKILVLGGTGFIGPPTVRYAVERGHEVTIFSRGRSRSDVPGVRHMIGDRNNDLSALKGHHWDVVIDNNARDYRWVKLSTDLLKDSTEHYVFISTISAYAAETFSTGYALVDNPYSGPQISASSSLAQPPDGFEMGQELSYGPSKALAEKLVRAAFPGRATVVRPGFIVGPGDPSDRFTYWPARIDTGGEILVPGDGTDQIQIVDVRDLMEFTVRLAESSTFGDFNGVGPSSPLSMAEMIYGIRAVTSSRVQFSWVPISFLRGVDIRPYVDMPIWIPGDPLSSVDNSLAVDAGLTFRPLAVTAADTLAWHKERPEQERRKLRIGIDAKREKEVLRAWHESTA